MQNTVKNNPGSVASYDTLPGNKVGLFNNAPEPTWGTFGKYYLINGTYVSTLFLFLGYRVQLRERYAVKC